MKVGLSNGKSRQRALSWKPHILSYGAKELRVLSFATKQDLFAAIDLLFTPKFSGMPFDLAAGRCLIVPRDGIALFDDSGLMYTVEPLATKADLSAAQRRAHSKRLAP